MGASAQSATSKYYDGLPQEPETSSVGFTPEMAQKSLADYFERTDAQFKMLGEQFNLGSEDVKDSYMLLRSAYDPNTNPDEELKLLDAMNTRKPEVQAYRQRLEKEQGFLPWTEKVFSDTARMLPSTFTTIEHGLATGAPAAVAGGAVAYPAGPIPALTTALSWGALGSRAGAAEAAFTISFGEVYKEALTKTDANGQRMPRETARQTAFAAAGVMAILEMAELKILGQAGKKGAAAILKTPGMQKLIYNAMLKRAKDMGYDIIKEVGVEGAQEMAKQMSFMAAGLYEKRDAQAYVKFINDRDAEGNDRSAVGQVGSAIINAIGPSALMIGGSSAIGSAGGAAAKAAGIGTDKEGQITYKGAPIIDQLKKVNAQLDAEAELPGGVEVESLTIAEDGKVVAKKAQAGLVMNEEGQFVLQGGIAVDDTAPTADMAPAAETISNATGLPTDLVQEGLKALDTALTQTTDNTQTVTAEEIAQAGLDALFPAEQAPAPEQAASKLDLAKVMSGEYDNYAMSLSSYADTVYSETSVDGLANFLSGGEMGPMGQGRLFFSNDPSLALGQGTNQGVLVELQAEGVTGQVNRGKPGLAPLAEQGLAEFTGRLEENPSQYVKSITFDLSKVDVQSKGWAANVYRSLLRDEGYVHETVDGKTKFTVQAKAPQQALRKTPQKQVQPITPEQIRALPNTLDDVEVRPLAPIEIEARQNQIASDLRMVGAEVRKLEQEYDKRFVANERAAQLKEEIATLQQEQKGNAEQIKQLNSDLKQKIKAGKPDANITKTLDMFGERQQAVVDQLTTKQLELNNVQQKPMARVEAALNKMYEVQDTLKFEQDLLREGLMDAQDVRGAQGKLKIQKVANLIDRLNASVQRSAKKAKTATLREVRAAQAALKKLITEAGLTKENQAKLLKKINTVTSMDKLATVLPEVQSQVLTLQEQQLAEAMTAKVEKLLESAKLKKGSKYPKGKFSPETQKTLNLFKQFIKDPAARETAINARFEKAFSEDPDVQNSITQDEYLASDIALSLAGFESFDSAQLEAVAQTIADTIELGRSESQLAAEKRKAETDAVVEVAKETFDKGPPIRRDRLGGVERFKQNLGRWYNRALKGDSSWASLMNLLSEYDPDHKLTEALSDITPTRLQDKGRNESIQGLSTVMDGVLQANKIQGDLYTFAQETANDGNTVYEVEGLGTLEKGDVMRLYANFYCAVTEPNVRSAMENAGISFYDNFGENSTEASVEGHLRAVEKEAVIATVQYLTTSTYARYNEVFRQENNVDLPKAQRYFPLEIAGYEGKVGDMLAEKTMTRGVTPGSAYSRTKHNKPIEIKGDFWATVGRHLDEVEHYRSHVKFVRHLNAVFKNGEVRDAVKNRYGPEIQSLVNNFIERFTQNSRYSATAKTSGVDWLRGNLTKAYLGANILQIPKVMTSMNLITMNLTPAQWAVGAKGLAQNWEATMTALFNEPSIKERYRNANEDIRAAQSSAPFAAFRKVPDISSMLMTAFRIGDSGSVMFAGGTLYNAELARGRTPGQALNEVVRMVQQTQGASTVAETTPQRAASDIGRLVSMFTQQLNQQLQHEEQAARDIVRALQNPDITPAKRKEVVGRGVRQLLNLRASIGLFTAVSSATSLLFLPSDRDDEPERLAKEAGRIALAMAIGPVGGLMYIGPVIEFALQAIAAYSMGEKGPRMPRGLPIWDTVENVGKFLKLSMDIAIPSEDDGWMSVEEVDEENKKWAKAAARVTGQLTGLPVGRVVDSTIMAQELIESGDPAGAVLAGLGANTGDLRRRAVNEDDEEPQLSPAEWLVQSANDALEVVKMQNAEDDEAEGDVLDLEALNALETPPVDDNIPENDIVDINLTPDFVAPEAPAL